MAQSPIAPPIVSRAKATIDGAIGDYKATIDGAIGDYKAAIDGAIGDYRLRSNRIA
jgi:hypothetical protein